ncbi:ADP-ribosylglycohydrolase family protein [Candidatus Saccharibacteria bacterium]|nr:ADP-ribosylglycohydrolase family protein [Candidatus Saccharibacteria bacterium]
MNVSLEQRGEGAMLGLAVGDLMGSPFEGYDITTDPREYELFQGYDQVDPEDPTHGWKPRAVEMIDHIRGLPNKLVVEYIGYLGTNFWNYGETTDDTAQAVALAESLVANGGLDPQDAANRFVEWYDGGNGRGMGGTTALSLQLLDPEETHPPFPWDEASTVARRLTSRIPVHYKGRNHERPYPVRAVPSNGALMRVAPIGLWYRKSSYERLSATRDATVITHGFDECVEASRVQTDIIAYLSLGIPKDEVLAMVQTLSPNVFKESKKALKQPTDELGHTGGAYTTLGVALDSLENTDNFRDAIVSAINSSVLRQPWAADVDTYGAVAGALAGACYGVEDIPKEWYELKHPDGSRHDLQPYGSAYLRSLGRTLVNSGVL